MAAADIKLISVCLTIVILIQAQLLQATDDPIELKFCPGESTELQMEHSLIVPRAASVNWYWYVNGEEQKKTEDTLDMIFKFTFKPNKGGIFEIISKIEDNWSGDEVSTNITTVMVVQAATPVLNVNGKEVNNNTEWTVLHGETIEVGCSASGSELNLTCDGVSNVGNNTVTFGNVIVTSDNHQQQCTCVIQHPLVCNYGNEALFTFNVISGPVSVTAGPGNILHFFLDPSEPTTLNLTCTHDTTKVVPNATVTLTGIPGAPSTPNVTTTQGSHLISHFTFRPTETGFFTVVCTAVNTENTAFNAKDSMIVFVQNSSMKLFDRNYILMTCIAILLTTMN